jgi:hypothetical protein
MSRVLCLALVIAAVLGCSRPPAGPPAPPKEGPAPAESEAVEVVRRHVLEKAAEPKTVRFTWGSHDLDGKLAAAVKRWKAATSRRLPVGTVVGHVDVTPDLKIVAVAVNELMNFGGQRRNTGRIYFVRGGQVIEPPILPEAADFPRSASPGPYLHSHRADGFDGWLERDLQLLADPLD